MNEKEINEAEQKVMSEISCLKCIHLYRCYEFRGIQQVVKMPKGMEKFQAINPINEAKICSDYIPFTETTFRIPREES